MQEKYRINQIVPAAGWYAHLFNNEGGIDLTWPFVCWALVRKETGETAIVGMIEYCKEIIIAASIDDHPKNARISFHGYVTQETVDQWKKEK